MRHSLANFDPYDPYADLTEQSLNERETAEKDVEEAEEATAAQDERERKRAIEQGARDAERDEWREVRESQKKTLAVKPTAKPAAKVLTLPSKKDWLVDRKLAVGINLIVGDGADEHIAQLAEQEGLSILTIGADAEPMPDFRHDDTEVDAKVIYFADLYRSPDWTPATAAKRIRELAEDSMWYGNASAVVFRMDRLNSTLYRIAAHTISLPKGVNRRFAVPGGIQGWISQQIVGGVTRAELTQAAIKAGLNLSTIQGELSRMVHGGLIEAETIYRPYTREN